MRSNGPALSAVFVDYDNIYLSLKRKNDEAAKRFAKDAGLWLSEIASGRIVTATNSLSPITERRVVMSRCYGNPVPRRNTSDNSTDMNSFPFVRHHFLRSGFEAIDCPPLTAQLKNSADIRMVMDIRDCLNHDTYFDEFVILSGDADFTPLLHRLRSHARRTVIFANDHTAAPYTAIADGEIRESALLALLSEGRSVEGEPGLTTSQTLKPAGNVEAWGRDIIATVVETVRAAGQPVPLEALADRAVRALGHERTVASGWGGAGSFRELLAKSLPQDLRLSGDPPYVVYDASRQIAAPETIRLERQEPRESSLASASIDARSAAEPAQLQPAVHPAAQIPPPALPQPSVSAQPMARVATSPERSAPATGFVPQPPPPLPPQIATPAPGAGAPQAPSMRPAAPAPAAQQAANPPPSLSGRGGAGMPPSPSFEPAPARPAAAPAAARAPQADTPTAEQRSIARIFEACQAPPLSPPEYRILFDSLAQEITANGLTGAQTLVNIAARAHELGLELRRDDVRFVLEVVSEADPWFEQGASTALFASRFRNFVVARCRGQGLNLSLDELNLIEQWFSVNLGGQRAAVPAYARTAAPAQQAPAPAPQATPGVRAGGPPQQPAPQVASQPPVFVPPPGGGQPMQQAPQGQAALAPATGDRWWNLDEARSQQAEARGYDDPDEFPRIVKNRLRG